MTDKKDNPELKTSLRHAYRSETVSPYFAKRVIANVEGRKRSFSLWPKLAAGLVSITVISILLTTSKESVNLVDDDMTAQTSTHMRIPSISLPKYPASNIDIPSLSSVSNIPTLNRFNLPAVSFDSSGDFCVYKQSGEMSC